MRAKPARRSAAPGCEAVVLLALVATTACAGLIPTSLNPTAQRYRALTADWQRAEARALPARDELERADRLFAGAAAFERAELVRQVLERNPSLRAARYAWRAALARYPQVTALDDPVLGAGIAPLSLGSNRVNDAPKFDLSQKLPFPGKLWLRGEVALAEAEAASHDHAAVRLRLAAMASQLFDDYAFAARALEINAEHVELLEEFQRSAAARYEAGDGSLQDPLQAEVEMTHALHREVLLTTAGRVAAEQINALLHRSPKAWLPPPGDPIAPGAAAGPAESAAPGVEPEVRMADALARRPELAAAEARVAAEKARVDAAWRDYFPDLTVTGSYNELWQERDLQPFVGVALNVPLQLGRRKAAVEEAQARLEQARSQRSAIEDELRFSVESSAERLAEAAHITHLYRDRLFPAARDQVAAARSGFETGRSSFLALIDAERNLRTVELGHAEALANVSRRRADFERALGQIPGLTW